MLCKVEDNFERNDFTFSKELKFPTEFELKNIGRKRT
jgi:hypothetical protein